MSLIYSIQPLVSLLGVVYLAVALIIGEILWRSGATTATIARKVTHIIIGMSAWLVYYYAVTIMDLAAICVLVIVVVTIENWLRIFGSLHTCGSNGKIVGLILFPLAYLSLWICFYNDLFVAIASIMALALGDSAACIIGRSFTPQHIVKTSKTRLGSAAMFAVTGAAIVVTMLILSSIVWWQTIIIAVISAALATVVEYYSHGSIDNITVPWITAVTIILTSLLFT